MKSGASRIAAGFKKRLLYFWTDTNLKQPSSGANIAVLDGIRGLAVLTVIASHTAAFGMYGQGGLGVWLFFVLSGFLLSMPFCRNPELILEKKYLFSFYKRRILRIIPMYYFYIIVIMTLYYHTDSKTVFEHLFFREANGHLWSIPQELLFYLLLPLIFLGGFFLKKNKPIYSVCLLLIEYIVTRPPLNAYLRFMHGNSKILTFYLYCFLVGVALAYFYNSTKTIIDNYLKNINYQYIFYILIEYTGIFCLSIFILTSKTNKHILYDIFNFNIINKSQYLVWRYPFYFSMFCAVLIFLTLYSKSILNVIFSLRPLRMIGVTGYSMYILHWPIMHFVKKTFGHAGNMYFFQVLTITFICSVFSYGFIERQFMKLILQGK